MKLRNITAAAGLAMFTLAASMPVFADTKAEINVSVSEALKQFNMLDPGHEALEQRAAGMLVFPHVTKGGAGIAGEWGEGVLQVKGKTVGYYKVTSASVGLTLGVAKRSEIIMFMNQQALDKFTTSKGWSIGADTGIALMSKGAGGDYDSKTLQRPILGFVFGEKGLIADLSLEGSKVTKYEMNNK
jgi:lipid-binding SYLF domain-containing protein